MNGLKGEMDTGMERVHLHDEVTVALEVGIDALEIGNRAVGRLQGERLVGVKEDFFVDAALEGAHG